MNPALRKGGVKPAVSSCPVRYFDTQGVLSARLLAPLKISHFCGLRPSMEFLTGLASNGASSYYYRIVFSFVFPNAG